MKCTLHTPVMAEQQREGLGDCDGDKLHCLAALFAEEELHIHTSSLKVKSLSYTIFLPIALSETFWNM